MGYFSFRAPRRTLARMTSSHHSTLPRLDSSSSSPATGGSSSAPLSRDGSASSSTQPHHKGGILLVPSPSDSLPCPSPTPSSSGQSALSTAGGPSKIHFAPLPPAPERRHSISLGVASRSSLLHSQGSSAGGKSASGGGGGDGQVKWVAMTDEEWDAYKRQYGVSTGGEDGAGGGEVPDLGTFVLKGGKKMLNKLRSMSTSSSVSSSSTESSAALGATPSVDVTTSDDRKGLMRFGRGRNRSVSPAGSGSPASSVPPPVVVRRASSAGPAGTPDVVNPITDDVEPRAIAIVEEQPEEEEEEQQVVVVRKSRPPSPAPVRHRSPPPSESEYIPSEGESEEASSTRSPSDVSSAFSDSDSDHEDSVVVDDPSEAPTPSTVFPHHPTPPGSGSATPHAAGTRSRSASITIAALPQHPGRRSSQLKEDERERLILGFTGSLERVALDRQAKGE